VLAIGEPGGWTAGVRWVQIAGHTYYRFHVAVIDPIGQVANPTLATMIAEPWTAAEVTSADATSSATHEALSIPPYRHA